MPVFDKQLRFSNTTNPQEMISAMAKHIKYIQEQLEYTLLNLDSRNITEIDTDVTTITDTSGTTTIGAYLSLTGSIHCGEEHDDRAIRVFHQRQRRRTAHVSIE